MASSKKRTGDENDRSDYQKRSNPGDLEFDLDYSKVQDSGSSDDDEINMITATGEIIRVAVKGSDTIDKIKLKIQAQKHIPIGQQEMFFKQKVPENSTFILPIKKEPTLAPRREPSDFMNIFIKNLEGRIIYSLDVKPSDTIGKLKAKMHDFRHVLVFGGVVVEDSGTLADFNIINGSTLIRIDKSEGKMEIFVKTFTGNTISLLVTPSDTIANVKLEICYRERICTDEQTLIFNGMALGDSGTLFDFHIKGQSTLTLVRSRSGGLMRIFIKTFKEGTIDLEVNPSHTIGNVKSKIQDEIDIPSDEQELIFNGMVLDNMDTLADSHIIEESTLTLVRISTGCINICIKTLNGNIINMKVKPSSTIYDVKSKIGNSEGIPRCQLMLIFDGRRLQDGGTLADYHIHDK